ncbi:MAG: fimbrillin family protein, partial [Lachnospiraceae bacterium]|nr:fimbrillin family protein [Lachnospiraceae bacterium]
MKKAYIYLTFIVMAVLAVACSKNGSLVDPTKPETAREDNIGFGSVGAHRVGEVDPDPNEKLQIQVYDYYKATSEATEIEYIDELLQKAKKESTSEEDTWVYVKEGKSHSYSWKKGAHKFFGWVAVDESGAGVSNLNYDDETKVLTISGENNAAIAAADYRYAEIKNVDWPSEAMYVKDATGKITGVKPVSLNVKHLTSALTFTVKDYSYVGDLEINSISVGDVKTKGSATVDYSGDAQAVTLSLGDETGAVAFPLPETTPFSPESEDGPGVFNGDTTCVWPQAYEDLQMTVVYTPTGHDSITATVDIP